MTLKLTLALVMAFITAVIVGKFYVPWLSGAGDKGKRPDMAHVKVRNADYGRRHLHKRVHTCVSDCRF